MAQLLAVLIAASWVLVSNPESTSDDQLLPEKHVVPQFQTRLKANLNATDFVKSQLRSANLGMLEASADCLWTPCVGIALPGQITCDKIGSQYEYTGNTDKSDCSFVTEKNQCCKRAEGEVCGWTQCAHMAINGQDECDKLGDQFEYTGVTYKVDCETFFERNRCCKRAKPAQECKWTSCCGLTIKGQKTCDDQFGNIYKYTGKTKKGDCGWTSEKNQCCKQVL